MAARGLGPQAPLTSELVALGWTLPLVQALLQDPTGSDKADPLETDGAVLRWLASRGDVRGILEAIQGSAGVISQVVEAVRAYARVDAPSFRAADLGESLDQALALIAGRIPPGVQVVREWPAEPLRVPTRGSGLTHVWVNLMENALDAMGVEGTLTLRARRKGDGIQVEVEDTGHGVAEPLRARIFDPFFSTREPGRRTGMGLGLHVARSIVVNQHRGRIEVEPHPGGTLFRVSLPSTAPSAQAPSA